jgi:hypothetical protein
MEHQLFKEDFCFPDKNWRPSVRISAKEKHLEQPRASQPVPNKETLPLTEAKPFSHREGVHVSHDYQPTAWPMVSRPESSGRTPSDTLITRQTRMTGRANKKGWKTAKPTARLQQKVRKAEKWMAKHG